ncbi:MAG: hypothetical protein M1482_12305, partial [Chloroflexi bacterium]|nr:hypothetical protein [Chloroflexota bacterium]
RERPCDRRRRRPANPALHGRGGPIHLLLTDWYMPRLDGGGLIRRLSDGRPETAILVMSGSMNGELPAKSSILRKPFDSHALVESVNGALQGQRA